MRRASFEWDVHALEPYILTGMRMSLYAASTSATTSAPLTGREVQQAFYPSSEGLGTPFAPVVHHR